MKYNLPIPAIALLAAVGLAAGCSDDSDLPVDDNAGDGKIAFDATRSEPTTTLTIPNFKVNAFKRNAWGGHDKIMNNVEVIRVGLNRWEYSPAVEWPAEPVDFYAVSPMTVRLNDEYFNQTVPYNQTSNGNGDFWNASDTDLLIAVRMGADQSSGRIRLNFRHALARVSLQLKTSDNDRQYVRVRRVTLEGRSEGTFSFPMRPRRSIPMTARLSTVGQSGTPEPPGWCFSRLSTSIWR